jgi:hypothetical protein
VDLGTVIAVAIPNVVAVVAIVAGWRQQVRTLEAERELTDLSNIRTVLDDAAVALHDAAYALDDARSHLTQYGAGFFADPEREKPYHALWQVGQRRDVLVERLSIRFGRDRDVTREFRAADEAVLGIWRKLGLLRLEPEADTEVGRQQVFEFVNRTRQETEAIRQTFDAKRESFIDLAQRAAGAQLPGESDAA